MKQCSEGMRRRVGIASTLIGDPEIVIMDEPTAGIDPKERISFYKNGKECFAG
jgi:ABC-2 type transport system ATP-binding protein